jgi:hypothetical protein
MDERARRVGENEALFRAVNEQVSQLSEQFESVEEPMSAICECGRLDCNDRLEVTTTAYERVRDDGALFLIKPGHVAEDVESVVRREDTYWVIRKHAGEPAALARDTDPRS